jgi:hypothetical protein
VDLPAVSSLGVAAAGFDRLFQACLPLPLQSIFFFGKENIEDNCELELGSLQSPDSRVQTGGKSHFRSAESLPIGNFPGKIA